MKCTFVSMFLIQSHMYMHTQKCEHLHLLLKLHLLFFSFIELHDFYTLLLHQTTLFYVKLFFCLYLIDITIKSDYTDWMRQS